MLASFGFLCAEACEHIEHNKVSKNIHKSPPSPNNLGQPSMWSLFIFTCSISVGQCRDTVVWVRSCIFTLFDLLCWGCRRVLKTNTCCTAKHSLCCICTLSPLTLCFRCTPVCYRYFKCKLKRWALQLAQGIQVHTWLFISLGWCLPVLVLHLIDRSNPCAQTQSIANPIRQWGASRCRCLSTLHSTITLGALPL